MTKKDFQLIAATLALRARGNGKLAQALHDVIVDDFANALATTNPLFKRDLFVQAATGQKPRCVACGVTTARISSHGLCYHCAMDVAQNRVAPPRNTHKPGANDVGR